MDSLLIALLEMHRNSALDGRPFRLRLNLWFQGFAVVGEVCTAQEYLAEQPQPLPDLLKAIENAAAGEAVRHDALTKSHDLDEPCWIHLRGVRYLFEPPSERVEPAVESLRADLIFLIAWSVAEVSGNIPKLRA